MKRAGLFAFLLFLLVPRFAGAQTPTWSGILSPSRAINWSNAGVVGGIPARTTICATIAAGASAATVNAAIASCPAGETVLLSAGSYTFSTGIVWNNKSGVTLRGAGADQTLITFTGNDSCLGSIADFCMESGDANYNGGPSNVANWTANYAVGATSITLSSKTNLAVGTPITLDQLDDTTDSGDVFICSVQGTCAINGDGGGPRSGRGQQQIVNVTSISGAGPYIIGISPGLYMPNWRTSQTPQAWWSSSPVNGDGVESLSANHSSSGALSGVAFFNCTNCWVKGIRSVGPTGRDHVKVFQSNHCSVLDSYFYKTNTSASVNYGVEEIPGSDVLIQNNVFEQIQAPYPSDGSCSGCVMAYNFDVNNTFDSGGGVFTWFNQSGFPHAVGDEHILYEGNFGAGIYSDNFHGTHHFQTIFRNAYDGYQKNNGFNPTGGMTPLVLNAHSRFYNAIGNVLGSTILPHNVYENTTSDPHSGNDIFDVGIGNTIPNDPDTTRTFLRWGNYTVVPQASDTPANSGVRFVASEVPSAITNFSSPVPTSTALPPSFYLSAEPTWWPASTPWPPIGPDVTNGNVLICTSGSQSNTYVLSSGQCPAGSTTAAWAGHANAIPSMSCFLNVMKGNPDGTGSVLTFSASTCYGQTVVTNPPQAPTNLSATVN